MRWPRWRRRQWWGWLWLALVLAGPLVAIVIREVHLALSH